MNTILSRSLWVVLAGCCGLLATGEAMAATCTSQASGDWNDSATWSGCFTPGNNDSVVIANTHTVTLDVNSSGLTGVTINAGGTLQGDDTGKILKLGQGPSNTFTNNGTLNFGAGTAATVSLNRDSEWSGGGTWNLSILEVATRNLTFAAATTATLSFSGAAAPISIGTGTITSLTTITWNFTGSVAQTLPASTNVVYGAITTNNSAGVTPGVALTGTNLLSDLLVQGGIFNNGGLAITLAAGSDFAVQNAATFNLTGTSTMVTVSGGGTKTFNATAPCSTVNYGGANQTVTAESYGHLVLGGSGTKTMPGSAMTVGCNFTMSGTASATAAQALTVNGDFNISTAGATFSASTFSHQVRGNFSRTGTFNANTSTFSFNGSANQTVSGVTTFNNLALNNAAGMTLASNATVAGVMTFASGRVTTGVNRMIIGAAGSHTGSSSTSYVNGTMEKVGPLGTFAFAIGDATNFTPVTTAFTAGGATGSLAAVTSTPDHPAIGTSELDAGKSVNRYWTLTSIGLSGTYDATFTFVSGDIDTGADPAIFEGRRYSGGTWSVLTIGTRMALTTQATGNTGFGDFIFAQLPPDHYIVGHDESGVTCLTEAVTFTAHNSLHMPTAVDAGINLDITTSTGKGSWTGILAGGGVLLEGAAGDGAATYIFPGDESAVTLELSYTSPAADPEAVNFNAIDDLDRSETSGTVGFDGDDQDLVYSRTGFQFYNATDATSVIPVQIAGKRSDQGFGAKNLALRAVRVSDSNPAACAALFADGADVTVQLGAECRNPGTCAGQQVSITNNGNTTALATNDDNAAALTSAFGPVVLRFGVDSTAELHMAYPDAGQLQLHARYDLGDPSGTYMLGSSNDFVVRPFGFAVAVTGNPAAADENGAAFRAAEDDFTVEVTAVGWQAVDDANADGIPDGHAVADTDPANNANLGDNAALPGFGQETPAEGVSLGAALHLPVGGADPGLSGGTSLTTFSAGVDTTATARFAEVGIIEISAAVSDGDYLGIGAGVTAAASGKSGRVGRFHPFDFNVTGNTPSFVPACNADTTDFTYLTQPFDYGTAPQVTITARGKLGVTTTNYDGDWWKLANFTVAYAHDGDVLPGGVTLDSGAAGHTAVDCSSGACNGVFTSTFNGPFTYTRTVTPAAPFAGTVDITLGNIDDGDAAFAGNPFQFDDVGFSGGFSQQRWGRLVVGQGVGDPAIAVEVPVTAEYFNGTGFVLNGDDDCTAFTLASDVTLSNEVSGVQDGDQPMAIDAGTTSVTSGDGVLVDGLDTMTFSAPGAGNSGLVDISLDLDTVTGADLPWLQFDWDGEGLFETTTEGRASFGIFSRPDSLIYTREPW